MAGADLARVESAPVECLGCGEVRQLAKLRRLETGECPRCGYVGWAPSTALSEPVRRQLRERPLAVRRIRAVA